MLPVNVLAHQFRNHSRTIALTSSQQLAIENGEPRRTSQPDLAALHIVFNVVGFLAVQECMVAVNMTYPGK